MIMNDGSFLFFDMPASISWDELRARIENLDGARITNVISDLIVELWLDFTFCGHQFSVNNPMGEYWFFVEDAKCPRAILDIVINQLKL